MKVANKVFAVTGGGSGIGRELVLELVRRGAKVAALDVSKDGLDATVALTEAASVLPLVVDITDRERVEQVPGQIAERFGAVDGLINCAGIIQPFVPLVEVDYGVIDRVMQVNFFGTLYMTKAFLPHLLDRPEGHLTNVSSMGGFMPFPGQTLYGASKAAVKLLTEGLASELRDTNVGVTCVFPGAIATNIVENSGVQAHEIDPEASAHRTTPADEAARQIIDGIEAGKWRVIVGTDAKAMDAMVRLAPKRAARFIAKQMADVLEHD